MSGVVHRICNIANLGALVVSLLFGVTSSQASHNLSLPDVNYRISLAQNLQDADAPLLEEVGVSYAGPIFGDGMAWFEFRAMRIASDEVASTGMSIAIAYLAGDLLLTEHAKVVSVSPYGDDQLALVVIQDQSAGT